MSSEIGALLGNICPVGLLNKEFNFGYVLCEITQRSYQASRLPMKNFLEESVNIIRARAVVVELSHGLKSHNITSDGLVQILLKWNITTIGKMKKKTRFVFNQNYYKRKMSSKFAFTSDTCLVSYLLVKSDKCYITKYITFGESRIKPNK